MGISPIKGISPTGLELQTPFIEGLISKLQFYLPSFLGLTPFKFYTGPKIKDHCPVQVVCDQKRKSRALMEEPHVTGTKSFARFSHEEALKNNGVELTRREIYQQTRTRKDGSVVNEKVAQVVASLQAVASDPTNTNSEDDWRNDVFSKVMGPEKRGYVRCIGKMPSVKDNNASSSTSPQSVVQKLAHTQSVLNALVHVIKEHIPNVDLSGVLSSLDMEIPDMGQNNSTNENQRSSAGSRSHYTSSP